VTVAIPGKAMAFVRAATVLYSLFAAVWPRPGAAQDNPLERGRYLVETVAFCGVCHNTRDPKGQMLPGKELAGGRVMLLNELRTVVSNIAPGDIRAVAPNITPDPETGIGRWTDAEIATAIREGLRPDGSIIGPPMPIALYRGLSDRDLTAIVVYLRTVPPVRNAITQRSTYPFALEPYGPPVGHLPDPPDDPVARGAYIAGPLAHCMDCHTPPLTPVQRDWSRIGAGGMPFGGPWGVVVAPNITRDKVHGNISEWTDEQIIGVLTRGVTPDGRRLLPPMSARAAVYSHITPRDLHDLIAYLRSLPSH
jgi:mono/diheme cytochrome c family protein